MKRLFAVAALLALPVSDAVAAPWLFSMDFNDAGAATVCAVSDVKVLAVSSADCRKIGGVPSGAGSVALNAK